MSRKYLGRGAWSDDGTHATRPALGKRERTAPAAEPEEQSAPRPPSPPRARAVVPVKSAPKKRSSKKRGAAKT